MSEAHKKAEPGFCYFGEEKLQVEHFKDLFKEKIVFTSIKTLSSTSTGFKAPPALSIDVLVNPDKSLKEARINDRVNGITAKYDSFGKLVMDEWLLKHPESAEAARDYEQRLQVMLEYASSTQKHQMLQFKKQLLLPSAIKPQITAQAREEESGMTFGHIRKGGRKFPEYMMDKGAPTAKIQDSWTLYIPRKIVFSMGLENWMSCRLQWEGDSFVMTPLNYTMIPEKVQSSSTGEYSSLILPIPPNMLFIAGLKVGDYVEWVREGNLLSLRKTEENNPNARKVQKMTSNKYATIGVTIPKSLAEELKIEKGTYLFCTFGKDEKKKLRLWFEVGGRTRDVAELVHLDKEEYGERFVIRIPKSAREGLSIGDEFILEVKDGKLCMKKQQLSST